VSLCPRVTIKYFYIIPVDVNSKFFSISFAEGKYIKNIKKEREALLIIYISFTSLFCGFLLQYLITYSCGIVNGIGLMVSHLMISDF